MGRATVGTILVFAILLALPAGLAGAQSDLEGKTVKEIVFKGNRVYSDSTLTHKILTKVNQRFSEARLAKDEEALLLIFDRLTTEVAPVSGGVRVTFLVEELPNVITAVIFQGFRGLTEDEIKGAVDSRTGLPYSKLKVQRDERTLVDLLKANGYRFAEVQSATGEYAGGMQIVFTALEGPKVEVDEIRFIGNQTFDEGDLEDQMLLKESGFLASYDFVETTLRQDVLSVLAFYRTEGFLDAAVDLRDVTFSPERDEATIVIGVQEGERYMVRDVEIIGGDVFPGDPGRLRALVKIEAGEPRRDEGILLTRAAIRNFYLENAYYDVQIGLEAEDDKKTRQSVIRYRIKEGKPARIRRVDIVGNTATREDVVRRNLSVYPGGPLNSVEIAKSRNRLEATNYFEQGGIQARVVDTKEPGVKDVVFSLSEGTTGSIRFSAGITSDLGFLGLVELTKNNFDYADLPEKFGDVIAGKAFTGGGQRLNLLVSPGTEFSQFRIAFDEPWFLEEYVFYGPSGEVEESPFSFGIDLYHTIFSRFRYDERRTGISFSTGKAWRKPGREIDDVFRWGFGATVETVRMEDLDDDAAPNVFLFEGGNRVRKIRMNVAWSHVDKPASPGEGWQTSLIYTYAGGFLGGDVDFHKAEFRTTNYFTLYTTKTDQRHILTFNGRVGWAGEFGDSDQVPPFERFFLGGSTTVRGFEFGEVGPRAEGNPFTEEGRELIRRSLVDGDGDPLGGQGMWLAKLEYGFPLIEDFLRGVVFVDSGNVSDVWDSDLWSKFRVAAGAGLRIKIPFLGPTPVALDFAFPIREEDGDDTQVLSFSFDRPF